MAGSPGLALKLASSSDFSFPGSSETEGHWVFTRPSLRDVGRGLLARVPKYLSHGYHRRLFPTEDHMPGHVARVMKRWIQRTLAKALQAAPITDGVHAETGGFRRNPGKPDPHRSRRKSDRTIDDVLVIYSQTKEGCRKVAAAFNRIHAHERGETVSKTFVAELIKKYHYRIAQVSMHCKHRVPPPLPINDTWGLDMTGKCDESGALHAIVGLIDHGSRRALALHPLGERDASALLAIVVMAVAQFGKPRCIRTDNDSVFRSEVFRRGLARLGIWHRFSKPGHPWENGRVERLFLTLKEKLNQLIVANVEALDQALAIFRRWYNEVRPHDHLGGATPLEAWHGIDPYKLTPKAVELFIGWGGLLTGYYLRR